MWFTGNNLVVQSFQVSSLVVASAEKISKTECPRKCFSQNLSKILANF